MVRRLIFPVMLLSLTGVLAGCAAPSAPQASVDPLPDKTEALAASEGRSCFYANAVERYFPVDDNHLEIKDYRGRTFEVVLGGACFSFESTLQIGLRTRGGQRVCGARDAEVVYHDQTSGRLRTCQIVSVTEVSSPPPVAGADKSAN